jgi:hypothetical protein
LFAPPPSSLKLSTSLPPAKLIADSVKRSSRANLFHFYSPLCEIASVLRKAPSACISVDRLAVLSGVPAEKERKEMESAAIGRTHHASSSRRGPGHLVSFDARELARECLKEVGRELGVPRWSRGGCFPSLLSSGDVLLMCALRYVGVSIQSRLCINTPEECVFQGARGELQKYHHNTTQ